MLPSKVRKINPPRGDLVEPVVSEKAAGQDIVAQEE